jgi:hypothetical protein
VIESAKTRIKTIAAPYGREIQLDEVAFESGMSLLRVAIREGRRFTILDLDPDTAALWANAMASWSDRHRR